MPENFPPTKLESIKKIVTFAIWPIIGCLLHPVYLIVNTSAYYHLGSIHLASFRLGSLTLGILCESLAVCFSQSVGTLISQAAGAKDFKL
jgi:Na+-driven multidrug efflux pump